MTVVHPAGMDPITLLVVLGFSALLLAMLAGFLLHRSITGVRSSGRYTAPPEF